ncbi:Acyl-CoA dehydrogenase [Mycena venus]|uniref:Acyl-CoA dehydrogenase n=1 Tax=Mycena venus TaxID=2733690 RepID=A0A8H7DH65_9AGAR|nr:Acyl-CoA dehydrogenase [Mycena venus]
MPLSDLKVVEFGGLGPVAPPSDILCRGKNSAAMNPKILSGKAALTKLVASADILIDPFRPGVMERLGLGPENGQFPEDRSVQGYGGCDFSLFIQAGLLMSLRHDINFLALSQEVILPGSLDKPSFPMKLLGDFAGGGLACTLGILLALIECGKSGSGQVVDADMVRFRHAISLLIPSVGPTFAGSERQVPADDSDDSEHERHARIPTSRRRRAILQYIRLQRRSMDVGRMSRAGVFEVFLEGFVKAVPAGFNFDGWTPTLDVHSDRGEWPKLREYLTRAFATRERDYWAGVFYVLTTEEAAALDSSILHSQCPIRESSLCDLKIPESSVSIAFPCALGSIH